MKPVIGPVYIDMLGPLLHKIECFVAVVLFWAQPGNYTVGMRVDFFHNGDLQTLLIILDWLMQRASIQRRRAWSFDRRYLSATSRLRVIGMMPLSSSFPSACTRTCDESSFEPHAYDSASYFKYLSYKAINTGFWLSNNKSHGWGIDGWRGAQRHNVLHV
jgi:hypothetical protein